MSRSVNLYGNIVTFTAGAANAENTILHGMPCIPQGFLVVGQNAAGRIYRSSSLGTANALATSFIAGWEFENSGNLGLDSGTNALNLTNSASPVTQNAGGAVGAAGNFVRASSQCLTYADNALLKTGSSFTWAGWFYLDSKPAASNQDPIGKGSVAGGSHNYFLRYATTADRFLWGFLKSDSSGYALVTANTFGALNLTTWYFVVCWYDAVAAKLYISVNNGAADETATALGPIQTTDAFAIGRLGAYNGNYWNGRLDQIMFWKQALSATDRTSVYNSGAGITVSTILATSAGTLIPWTNTNAFLKSSIAGVTYSILFFA
jgi:hypothetical protein